MFSGLRDKLAEGVRELEASLSQPLPSPSPPRTRPAPTSTTSAASPSPLRTTALANSASVGAARASLDGGGRNSPGGVGDSPRAAAGAAGAGGEGAPLQSASQLADQALSSLRMSFKKGRVSMDSVKSRASGELTRSASVDVALALDKAHTLTEEPKSLVAEEENGVGTVKEEPKVDPPQVEESPATVVAVAVASPIAQPPTPIIHSPSPEASPFLPSFRSTTAYEPLFRPNSPDTRFTISTPEGPSRSPTPAAPTDSPRPGTPPTTSLAPELSPLAEEPLLAVLESTPPTPEPNSSPLLRDAPLPPTTVPPTEPVSEQVPEVQKAVEEVEETAEASSPDQHVITDVAPPPPPADPLPIESIPSVEISNPTPSVAVDPATAELKKAYDELLQLKDSLDKIVSEVIGLSGVSDVEAFEGELRNMAGKTSMAMNEMRRLTGQIEQQKERTEELRDVHRLEVKSQSDQVESLTTQLASKDAALHLVSAQLSKLEQESAAALAKATEDYDKLKIVAKEEEEKRIKALSLLRALRQKLVKAEKDKEDLEKEKDALRASEAAATESVKTDRARYDQEVVSLRATQELQLSKMRASFDRESNSIRAQSEREAMARKGQFELDVITTKAVHGRELQVKDSRILQLEETVRSLTVERDSFFDQLQLRTAETESAIAQQETLAGQAAELQYELNEANDRAAGLLEELEELRKARRDVSRDDGNTRKLLVEAEARYDAKVRDLEARADQLEKDRLETEEEMGRNLQDRLGEVERMRQLLARKDIDYAESVHSSQQMHAKISRAENERKELQAKLKGLEAVLGDLREDAAKYAKAEAAVREELRERTERSSDLEQRLEEVQLKESTLRSNNKILREELRKLQSGVLQSDKQRQPGVGYFASYSQAQPPPSAAFAAAAIPLSPGTSEGSLSRSASTSTLNLAPSTSGSAAANGGGEEALNFEYIRNVILQFLEQPKMRPHLVSVLGVILHFTPAESRRLAAKAV